MSDLESDDEIDSELASGFEYSIDLGSMKQGAEAKITECIYLGRKAIMKERFSKSYRHPVMDTRLNKARTKSELKGIVRAKELAVSTPAIYFVNSEKNIIIMERIVGPTAKNWIESQRENKEQFNEILYSFGKNLGNAIGRLHNGGMVHGDLTTSNVIVRNSDPKDLVFIDFGLCSQGKVTPEEKAVDLYVLERAISSTHIDSEKFFEGVLEGYKEPSQKQAISVNKKLDEVRLRGRKRDMTG
ncbi:unnamed protein product [Caenorhabditis bovis]|uniref:non-specific serine/threonine protein kinase n=1 Tax=Caenorhabditis bovis TaxID=2654633 RepID=A0A8S1FB54_9PELO|nr:unnamed protein product [Caenorhabditis bovis]